MLVNFLYIIAVTLLGSLAVLVYGHAPHSRLHRSFAATCLALIAWLVTVYFLVRSSDASSLTFIGRANFASVLIAVTFSFHFVSDLVRDDSLARWRPMVGIETAILTAITLFTPLVDRVESVRGSDHLTSI